MPAVVLGSTVEMTTTASGSGTAHSRMAPCPCGSGERYKNCCGSARRIDSGERRRAALAAQQRGDLHAARSAYETILADNGDDDDVRHMLALCLQQLGCVPEALAHYLTLLRRLPQLPAAVAQNLCLTVAAAACQFGHPHVQARLRALDAWRAACATAAPAPATLSVVMPSYNHGRYVTQALESVLAQSRPPDEIIVIDDGSRDDSLVRIHAVLDGCGIAHQVIARGNRGAAETLNEAIALARGEWIAPLNSDDLYAPGRLLALQQACQRQGVDWGFGAVRVIDDAGAVLGRDLPAARRLYAAHDTQHMTEGLGLGFLRGNAAISSGNLFFRKSLWQRVGGFASLRYNHDWRFCLDAARLAEPLFVPAATYHYRWHGSNTISDSDAAPRAEVARMFCDYFKTDTSTSEGGGNPFAPTATAWGPMFAAMLAAGGQLGALPRAELLAMLTDLAERTT